jgi:hypothetical protein
MRRTEYLRTIAGQAHAYHKRQARRLYIRVDQEPLTKRKDQKADAAFRLEVRRQMKAAKRGAFKGDLVLQIDFYSSRSVPYEVQELAKHYLDLLHKPIPGDQFKQLLFYDDRQVKLMITHQHPFDAGPHLFIQAYPLADLLRDAEYAQNILQNTFLDKDASFPYRHRLEYRHEPSPGGDFYALVDEYGKSDGRTGWFDQLRGRNLKDRIQEAFIARNQISTTDLINALQHLFLKNSRRRDDPLFQRLFSGTREYIFIGMDFIPAGGSPVRRGEGGPFRAHIRRQLKRFKNLHPYLFPLSQPVSLSIICIPPAFHSRDADNLANEIVALFNTVCMPPVVRTGLPGLRVHPKSREKLVATTGYQVIYLPRTPGDPERGRIEIVMGGGLFTEANLREKIEQVIADWERYCENR